MEPKSEIDGLIPAAFKPVTLFFTAGTGFDAISTALKEKKIGFPLVVKPDIGMQGKAVVRVDNEAELKNAAERFTVNFIVQPFIAYPKEVGIFYVRYPFDEHGTITGIVEKEFLTVTGDGQHSIEQLLSSSPRHILQLPALREKLGKKIHAVPEKGMRLELVPYGNHARGSMFLDSTGKKCKEIETVIDNVCRQIDEFYYGRLDIRFTCFEELAAGKNWCIIELNGAGSEPTHMYDPRHSLFFAWKEIIRHWEMLFRVSIQNKKRKHRFMPFKEGVAMFRANHAYVKKLDEIKFGVPDTR